MSKSRIAAGLVALACALAAPSAAQATGNSEWETIDDTSLGITYSCAQLHNYDNQYVREWTCILNGVQYYVACYTTEVYTQDGGTDFRVDCDVSGMWTTAPAVGLAEAHRGAELLGASLRGGNHARLPGWAGRASNEVEHRPNVPC